MNSVETTLVNPAGYLCATFDRRSQGVVATERHALPPW
jgi:hypothetical protein